MRAAYTERFRRSYSRLPAPLKEKFSRQLGFLLTNARHPSLQMHPVQGSPGIYEARVDQQYRFTFSKDRDTYILRVIGNHDDVLKNP